MWSTYNCSKFNCFVWKFLSVSKHSWNKLECLYEKWKMKGLDSINSFTERIWFLENQFLFSMQGQTVETIFSQGNKKEKTGKKEKKERKTKEKNCFSQKYRIYQNIWDSSMNSQPLPKLSGLGIDTGNRGSSPACTANNLTSNKGR